MPRLRYLGFASGTINRELIYSFGGIVVNRSDYHSQSGAKLPWFTPKERIHAAFGTGNICVLIILGILLYLDIAPYLFPIVLYSSLVLWGIRGLIYVLWDK